MARSTAVLQPNYGLYLNVSPLAAPSQAVVDGLNFRVHEGSLTNEALGWTRFETFQLNGPVRLIKRFFPRGLNEQLVFASNTDLYQYVPGSPATLSYLTPRYSTGTVAVSNANPGIVTGVGSLWLANTKVGDEISFGSNARTDPLATWYSIGVVTDNTHLTLVGPGVTLGAGTAYTIRKKFSTTNALFWSSAIFVDPDDGVNADLLFLTNGIDFISKWNGSDTQVTLETGYNFTCSVLQIFANMLIYGNLVQGGVALPTSIINSDIGKPEVVNGTGVSGQFRVHDRPEGIINMTPLGNNLAIYSRRRITFAQYTGSDTTFSFLQFGNDIGPIGPGMVADFGDHNEFLHNDGQYRFDGASLTLINPQIWQQTLEFQDASRSNIGFNMFDETFGELIWCMPSTSDPGLSTTGINTPPGFGWTEHYLEVIPVSSLSIAHPTPYSKRQFPFTAAGSWTGQTGPTWATIAGTWSSLVGPWDAAANFAAFPILLVGDTNGKIYTLNTSNVADGVPFASSYVTFGARPLGDGRMRGLLKRVYPFALTLGSAMNLEVTMLGMDAASEPPLSLGTYLYAMPAAAGAHFVSPFRRARYWEPVFGTTSQASPWQIDGYDFDQVIGGRR
jgi:hypothetical protein